MMELLKKEGIISALTKERIHLYDEVLDFVYPILNEVHGVSFSRRFWKILLRVFINSVISNRAILFSKEVLVPDYLPINRLAPDSIKQKIRRKIISGSKILLNVKNRSALLKMLRSGNNIVFGLPAIQEVEVDIGSIMPDYLPNFWINGNSNKRRKLNAIINDRITIDFQKQLLRSIPEIYVEYFEKILKRIPLIKPTERGVHAMVVKNYFEYFIIAKYVEAGAKLYFYQHGGYYGEYMYHNAYHFENSVSDCFRTWGWTLNNTDQPWRAYRLRKFSTSYHKHYNKELKYQLLLLYTIFDSSNTDKTVEYSEVLCSNIDFNKFQRILARPRPRSKLFSQKSELFFLENKPGIEISNGLTEVAYEIAQSGLVVQFQYPSTTFLECLFVDHPTVAILNNTEPTDQVKRFYEFFLAAGVFHYTMESLVTHINSVDIDQWWASVISSENYRAFKMNYCKF